MCQSESVYFILDSLLIDENHESSIFCVMNEKLDALKRILKSYEKALIAYCGGLDSAFLSYVARDVLQKRVITLTALSPSYPTYEIESAKQFLMEHDIEHIFIQSHELDNEAYKANTGDRCYHCKTELYDLCREEAQKRNITVILNGTNLDDLKDYRPGLKAAGEKYIQSPLVEAGFTKEDIRQCAKSLGLSVWNKPALACLSSRFPPGTEVTEERLQRIDRIESRLIELGFRQFRVRFHEPIARIEVSQEEFPRFLNNEVREDIIRICRENGFLHTALDLEGYKTGSVNQVLFQIK